MNPPIFIHIPKTAGSTLRTLITENYAADEVLSLYGDPKEILVAAAAQMGRTDTYRLIQGHTPYGTHRFLGIREPRYFTFLRDPVERLLSDIAHATRDEEHRFHRELAASGLSEDQRISVALDIPYYRNAIAHYVSGTFTTETISMTQLGVAIDNLWASEFVGVSEQFEVSLLIMAKKLGWQHVVPQKCNVRPDARKAVEPALKTRLDRALAYDRMLYAVAQDHLNQSRRHYGPLLDEAGAQLAELINQQEHEHPETRYSKYLVGEATQVALGNYHARIDVGSPLHRWLNP